MFTKKFKNNKSLFVLFILNFLLSRDKTVFEDLVSIKVDGKIVYIDKLTRESVSGDIVTKTDLGIKNKGTLINGKKDGEWIEYYNNSGDIFIKEFYESGMLNGWSFLYGTKGLFELKESVLLGKWYFVNGVENGACSTYLENGDLFRSYEYKDGSIINFIEHNEPNNK